MINKKNLWFLTLFSLILVLSVYYITMPSELLLTNTSSYLNKETTEKTSVEVEENEVLTALRVTDDENVEKEVTTLKEVLSNKESTVDQKNTAFEKIKNINTNRAKEKELEQLLQDTYKLQAFVKKNENQIKIVITSKKHDINLANKIMRSIQKEFTEKIYITVQFKG